MSAMHELLDHFTERGLYAFNVAISPARPNEKRFDFETNDWVDALPEIHLTMHNAPGEMLRWLGEFQVNQVHVHKERLATRFDTRAHRYGYIWSLTSSVKRPERGPRLPGLKVRWEKVRGMGDTATISRTEFRLALAGLGVHRREPGSPEPLPLLPWMTD
ncbi:hypothetical protein [Micromonospora sp. DT227]|uniref:hypothetical protein n=1 Tax=Micromonospora sp. DT227 TaxID=3393433 RepID=UPI003CF08F8E